MRQLINSDVPDLVRMMQALRIESPTLSYVADDPEFVMNNLDALMYSGTLVGVIEPRKGFMIGVVSNTWYSVKLEAMEQMLYIRPSFRGSTLAPRLVRAFEELVKDRGAWQLSVGTSTGIAEQKTINFYKRLGYVEHSPTLVKRL